MSFHYLEKQRTSRETGFVSLKNGYHGKRLGALSVTDVHVIPRYLCYVVETKHPTSLAGLARCRPGESAEDVAIRAAGALETYLAEGMRKPQP